MLRALALGIALAILPGCFSPYVTIPGRTAIDQQVTAESIRAAVHELDLSIVERIADPSGVPETFRVRVSAPRETDTDWIDACVRDRLHRAGYRVANDQYLAKDVHVFEAIVHHAASDLEQTLIGIPFYLPGQAISVGDLSLYKSNTVVGRTQLSAQVYDPNGALAALIPEVQESRYFRNETWFTFFGAFIRTDLENFVEPGDEEELAPQSDR